MKQSSESGLSSIKFKSDLSAVKGKFAYCGVKTDGQEGLCFLCVGAFTPAATVRSYHLRHRVCLYYSALSQ